MNALSKTYSRDNELKVILFILLGLGLMASTVLTVVSPIKTIVFTVAILIAFLALINETFLFIFIGMYIFYASLMAALSFHFISTSFNFSGAFRNFISFALFIRLLSIFNREKDIIKNHLLKDVSFILLVSFILWQFLSGLFTPYDVVEVLKANFQLYMFAFLLITFFYLRSFKDMNAVNVFLNTILILFIPVILYGVYEVITQFNPLNFYLKLTDSAQLEGLSGRDLYQAVSSQTFGQRSEISSTLRPTSIYAASNNFSINLNIVLMVLLYKISTLRKKSIKISLMFYCFFVLVMQFTTLTRTGILQLVGVFFAYLLLSNKPMSLKFRDISFAAIVSLILMVPFISLYGERSGDANIVERFFMWNIAVKIISEYTFFGIGAGNIMAEFSKRFYPILTTHNAWLDLFVVSGILGLIIMSMFYITIFFKSLRIHRKANNNLINETGGDNKKSFLLIEYGIYALIIIFIYSFSEPFSLPILPMVMCFSSFSFFSRVNNLNG